MTRVAIEQSWPRRDAMKRCFVEMSRIFITLGGDHDPEDRFCFSAVVSFAATDARIVAVQGQGKLATTKGTKDTNGLKRTKVGKERKLEKNERFERFNDVRFDSRWTVVALE